MSARATYDAFAPFYDEYTAHHRYDEWTATLERLARRAGLEGRRLLDVACGTGKSFLPFLERGYEVCACDVSPAMAALAAEKAAGRARVEVHDMRALPRLGEFDLVCCLDDAVNYLETEGDLVDAFTSLRRNLAPNGVVVFDANTLLAYRTYFASARVVQSPGRVLVWDGRTPEACRPAARRAASCSRSSAARSGGRALAWRTASATTPRQPCGPRWPPPACRGWRPTACGSTDPSPTGSTSSPAPRPCTWRARARRSKEKGGEHA